jgi:hypothetical protein
VCGSHSWIWNKGGSKDNVIDEIETPGAAHQVLFHESLNGGPVWCFLRGNARVVIETIIEQEGGPTWLLAPAAIQLSTKTSKCPRNPE